MIQALFRILEAEPDGLQAKDAISRVEAALELTEFELSTFPKNPDLVVSKDPSVLNDQLRQSRLDAQEERDLDPHR